VLGGEEARLVEGGGRQKGFSGQTRSRQNIEVTDSWYRFCRLTRTSTKRSWNGPYQKSSSWFKKGLISKKFARLTAALADRHEGKLIRCIRATERSVGVEPGTAAMKRKGFVPG